MKKCMRCGFEKEYSEFYKHKEMSDGYLNFCKECTKKRVSLYRSKNIEKIREYDRGRGKLEHRLKKNRDRNKKLNNYQKISRDKSKLKWYINNKNKIAAYTLLNNSIRSGKVIKPLSCSICGKNDIKIHGHHEDYTKPLKVLWCCFKCHAKIHRGKRIKK